MILAAGRGERMRPLTDKTPKPLLMAGGKPLIVWHIENLVRAGIKEIVINHAHLGEQIEEALKDGKGFGARIGYSAEKKALETAGGIANALSLLGDAPFVVINGDIYCDYDYAQLFNHAEALIASGDTAHLVLVNNPPHHPQGDFFLNGDRVSPLYPSPQSPILNPQSCPYLTFSGIGIYKPSLFRAITKGGAAPLAPLLKEQIALNKVSGEHHKGSWVDVGTPERLIALDAFLKSNSSRAHHA
jgi:MurNAc alpha-1-phosphate uridylyltransferase